MPTAHILRSSPIVRSVRVAQVEGMFDIAPSERSGEQWDVTLPLEERDWSIGAIVGPSGSGKSTIARELFGATVCTGFDWPSDRSLLDGFPTEQGIKDITALLSSVGFSSPPLWLRPFGVLSTGQQMRVTIARLLAEQLDLAVMDEFSSVVDRTVAQIGSAAIARTVRRRNQKFVAITCHYDVLDWLQPDWIYEPHTNVFQWRCLQRRPAIELDINRVHHTAWGLFRQYHYLDHTFNKAARCFVAFYQGQPVALQAVIATMHPKVKHLYRGHRAVCLPDYQGVGIGNALITYVASAYKALGNRILSTTASPALNASRTRDARWRCIKKPSLASVFGDSKWRETQGKSWTPALNRLTTTWEYVGATMDTTDAKALIYG